jgi:hypothetical protein
MVTPTVERDAVAHLRSVHEMSERRACRVIGCDRMMVCNRSRRADDPRLRERLVALARERRRFGYRRLLILLRLRYSLPSVLISNPLSMRAKAVSARFESEGFPNG